jgi:4-hydroxybenzoate polyprenyltransferase
MDSVKQLLSKIVTQFKSRFPELCAKLPALVELTRANKPIGIYLLLWPTIGALWIAEEGFPRLSLFLIFVLGTTLMRSAGCCVNDFADHKIDSHVGRTKKRPLVTGVLTRKDAIICFTVLSLISFGLVLLTNKQTIMLSFAAVALVAAYPFMKRFTNLPERFHSPPIYYLLQTVSGPSPTTPSMQWLIVNLISKLESNLLPFYLAMPTR